ncbi:ribonuclease P protein component [Verrucomicrobiota bacterium]
MNIRKRESMRSDTPKQEVSKILSGKPCVRLSRSQRLTNSREIGEVLKEGLRYVGKHMVLYQGTGEGSSLRLGVIAAKASFRRSVDRSRVKRLLREAFRLNRSKFNTSNDMLLLARRRILKASRQDVEKDLIVLARKAGILKREA